MKFSKKLIAVMMSCTAIVNLCTFNVMAEDTVSYYVSQSGNDKNDGTIESPFKTIEAAKLAAQKNKNSEVEIIIRGGKYYMNESLVFSEADTRNANAPLTVRSYEGEEVRIIGGKSIDATKFTKVTDGKILQRLPVDSRGKVYSLDMDEQGEFYYGAFVQYGTYHLDTSTILDIYVNGQRVNNARWPNEGYAKVDDVVKIGTKETPSLGRTPTTVDGGVISYSDDRISRWKGAQDAWLYGYWMYNWDISTIRIKDVDTEKKTITFDHATTFGIVSDQRYYAFNLLEELDIPGEWYIDRTTHMLYYYPQYDLDKTDMIISQIRDSIINVDNCANITFKGLTVECSINNNISIGTKAENIVINGCIVRNSGNTAVDIGGKNCGIKNSDVYDAGNNCIRVYGGVCDNTTYDLANNYVINCDVHDSGKKISTSICVRDEANGSIVEHNRLYNSPAAAINGGGFEKKWRYNEIFDCVKETSDAGALYLGRDSRHRGTEISYNYIHDIYGEYGLDYAFFCGVYLDDFEAGIDVQNNVFKNVSTPIYGHHAMQNNITGNLIINKTADTNGSIWWTSGAGYRSMIDDTSNAGGTFWQRHNMIDWTQEPYASRYPEAKELTLDNALYPVGNVIKNNVIVNHTSLNIAKEVYEYSDVSDNLIFDYDPGFEDFENGDYRLKADSEIYDKIPDFESPDITKMGIYPHPDRPQEFEKVEKAPMFNLIIPEDKAVGLNPNSVTFAWNMCTEFRIDRYRLTIAKDENFNEVVIDTDIGDISKEVNILEPNTTYYWKVAGVRGRGDEKEFFPNSDGVRSFRTSYHENEAIVDSEVKIDDFSRFIADQDNWKVGSAKNISVSNNEVTIESAGLSVSGYEGAYTEYNTLYHFNMVLDGGQWYAVCLHTGNTHELGWVKNSHYIVIIKPDAIELHKYPKEKAATMIDSIPRTTEFDPEINHDVVFGTYVINNENYVAFAIDGEVIYNMRDEANGDVGEGYFAVYTIGDKAKMKLSAPTSEPPEISTKKSDLPAAYNKILDYGIAMKAYSSRTYTDLCEKQIENKDVTIEPYVENGRTMIPLRFVSEAMGCNVEWNDTERSITVTNEDTMVKMTVDSDKGIINGEETMIETPVIKNNITYVPVRFVSEALGYNVKYDDETKVILILPEGNEKDIPTEGEWWQTLSNFIDYGNAHKTEFRKMA